jgi:hypothetical protein
MLLCVAVGNAGESGTGSEEQRRDFQAIAAQLDPGGELFLVLRAGRWMDRILKSLAEGQGGQPAAVPGEQEVRDAVERIRRFLNQQGISAFRGVGTSSVAREDGRHAFKLFLLRDAVDSNLPFWRGIFGWQPRRLSSLDFVPTGYSMVLAGTLEPSSLWRVLTDGMQEVAEPPVVARFEAMHAALAQWIGIPVEDLLGSLRDEFLVAVRFGRSPATDASEGEDGDNAATVPSFVIVVGTGEDVLRGVVEAQLARRQITLAESVVAGERMRHAQDPLVGSPCALQPAFASPSGFFVVGSSPAVVEEALLAYRHRNGLVTRPVFKDAFQGVAMVNNGIVYVDDDAARILQRWCGRRLESTSTAGAAPLPAAMRIRAALRPLGADLPACALVVQNWRHGVMLMGSAGIGGESLIKQAGTAVWYLWQRVWDGAAVLLPVPEGL